MTATLVLRGDIAVLLPNLWNALRRGPTLVVRPLTLLLATLAVGPLPAQTGTIYHSTDRLTVDGDLNDAFWRGAYPHNLTADELGVPERLGGTARFGLRGEQSLVVKPGGL